MGQSMSTITVSIGRNVGTEPLSDPTWRTFRTTVGNVVATWCETIYVSDAGCVGHWDGVDEESRTWVGEWAGYGEPNLLIDRLAEVARVYGQDAIAVTTGTTVLAGLQPATVA